MACFLKKPQGPTTRHILASEGPSSSHLSFYSTNYSINYPKKHSFPSKTFRHKGTGYIANFRPTIYYNKEVDRTQNPSIAKLLDDSYNSLTYRDYIPPELKIGMEQLPLAIRQGPSGYSHNTPITRVPLKEQVSSNTYYRNDYPLKEFRSDSKHPSHYTRKEDTGFTHAVNIEPVTYRPTECHASELPSHVTWRPTGRSIAKGDFTQAPLKTGHEGVPLLSHQSCLSNGYIKGNRCPAEAQPIDIKGPSLDKLHPQVIQSLSKRDPAMFSMVTHPPQYTSYSSVMYPPKHIHPYKENGNAIGKKEISGYSDNTLTKVTNIHPTQTTTTFKECFHGNNLRPDVDSHNTPGTMYPDGYTKSTNVHQYGPSLNSEQILRNQRPYVTRSILAQDPCYLDYTHRHKQRITA